MSVHLRGGHHVLRKTSRCCQVEAPGTQRSCFLRLHHTEPGDLSGVLEQDSFYQTVEL